ncbi:sigma factor-like helix-turn-helix DNA-binding protein [Streptomyces rochei]|uniref:sigma factor-like helix-turn-helix DNA-binding protein n=1 Tax=Streptomyces rochei TaxID=1928 RepID=UPI00369EE2CF
MTIVAERPVGPQVAERRLGRSYTTPARVDLRTAEDRPLSPEQAERVAALAAEHGDHLVRYAAARLGGAAYWAEAEEVAQEVWLRVARGRVPELLGAEPDPYEWPRLAATARYAAMEAARTDRRRETAAADDLAWERVSSGRDETACAVLDLDPEGGEWAPGCYADAIARLTPRQREVLELQCRDGMTQAAIASRLGISVRAVQMHQQAAIAALRGDDTTLPADWEQVLHRLPSAAQRDMVRLVATGTSQREAARRLGLSRNHAVRLYQRAVRSLREMAVDHRMDPVPAAPATGSSCTRCTTGCALRRGAEVAA